MPLIVLAPDKFKGSLTAAEVAAHLAAGLERAVPGIEVRRVPLADGGEGTVDAALAAGGRARTLTVTGPLGAPVEAAYALLDDGPGLTAVVEMAAASGLALTSADDEAARRSSSIGTGELIRDALDIGVDRIVLGVGGSASTDGGAGLVSALGVRLQDAAGIELAGGGAALRDLASVDLTRLDPRLAAVEIVLAADVENPLLGADGAAAVYGPQKGADAETVAELDAGLRRWVAALADAGLADAERVAREPGAGAAGGVGYAALALLGATRRPGIEVVLELVGFAERVAGADLVVTGEGSLDEQSLYGKTPVGVARAAAAAGVRTVAVAGRTTLDEPTLRAHGIDGVITLTEIEDDIAVCIAEAPRVLEDVADRIAQRWLTTEPITERTP